VRIGELSCRTGVPARLLRYYEEKNLLHPERDSNGYRSYGAADAGRVEQIRGLLDAGLTTEIIRRILPFLDCGIHLPAHCLTADTAELLERYPGLLGIYSAGAGNRGIAAALEAAGRARDVVWIAHELTQHTRRFLLHGTIDAIINQDAGHEARSAARILLAHCCAEPIVPDQERIRIEIFLRDNLP